MVDILIRGVSEHTLDAIDASARRAGISRNEYLRRRLDESASSEGSACTTADLRRIARSFADLGNPDVMQGAWD